MGVVLLVLKGRATMTAGDSQLRSARTGVNDRRRAGDRAGVLTADTPGRAARTTSGPSRRRRRRSRRWPRARRAAPGGAATASTGKTSRMIAELDGLDAEVEHEQRRQQRPRERRGRCPSARAKPRPCTRPKHEHDPSAQPAGPVEPERAARPSSSVASPRRHSRQRCQAATTAIESAMTGSTIDAGQRDDAERGEDEGHRVRDGERRGGEHDLAQPARPGDQRQQEQDVVDARVAGARRRGGRTPRTAQPLDCPVENDGCAASSCRAARVRTSRVVGEHDRLGAAAHSLRSRRRGPTR